MLVGVLCCFLGYIFPPFERNVAVDIPELHNVWVNFIQAVGSSFTA